MTDDSQHTTEADRPTTDPDAHRSADDSTDTGDGTDTGDTGTLDDRVEAALRAVRDPDAGVTVFEAGLVESIDVDGSDVTVQAAVTEFDDANARKTMEAMLRAVRDVPGVESANVEPVAPSSQDGDGGVAGFDTVIAVASAKGGVGKSTVATSLACALARDRDAGLFDADVHGPNVPSMLDVEGPIHSDEEGNPLPVRASGSTAALEVMSVGLMESGAPLAWRGAMAHDALTELFTGTAWANRDVLVVDLPPGTGDVVLTTLQEVPVDGVVVVTTPFPSSIDDTARSIELFRDNDVPVLGAVLNMGEFTCPTCGDDHDLFPGSSPADAIPAPVVAEVPFSTEMQETPVPGETARRIERLADDVMAAVATAREVDVPDDAVDVRDVPPQDRRERVRDAFTSLDPGDEFVLVSDRDPTPVTEFLGEIAGVRPTELGGVDVERRTPDAWVLSTKRP